MNPGRAFEVVFARPHRFGLLAAVRLSGASAAVPERVLDALSSDERTIAKDLRGFRQAEWVGGRLAARVAAERLGASAWSMTTGAMGEPRPPAGFIASVSHKRHLAIALVARDDGSGLGVDLEDDRDAIAHGAHLVFQAGELAMLDAMPESVRADARVTGFALKEAAYKALAVRYGRRIEYREATVSFTPDGSPLIVMHIDHAHVSPSLEIVHETHEGSIVVAVKAPRQAQLPTPSSSAR